MKRLGYTEVMHAALAFNFVGLKREDEVKESEGQDAISIALTLHPSPLPTAVSAVPRIAGVGGRAPEPLARVHALPPLPSSQPPPPLLLLISVSTLSISDFSFLVCIYSF